MPRVKQQTAHLAFLNAARAIMFACIVFDHTGEAVSDVVPPGTLQSALLALAPNGRYLFVTIAVVLIARSVSSSSLSRRLVVILTPFVAWSVITVGVDAVVGALPDESVGELLWRLASGSAAPHLYFVLVTVQLTIGAPIIRALARTPGRLVLPLLLAAALAQIATVVPEHHGGLERTLLYKTVLGYPLYIVGAAVLAPRIALVRRWAVRALPFVGLAVGVVGIGFAVAAFQSRSGALSGAAELVPLVLRQVWVITVSLLSLCVCVVATRTNPTSGVVARIGRSMQDLGFGLYLAHALVLRAVVELTASVLPAVGLEFGIVVGWTATVVLTVLLVSALRWTPLSRVLTGRPRKRRRPQHRLDPVPSTVVGGLAGAGR
ncbi:acyltransferase family protein [Curtobacterium sp. NPDC087082]|uniref:acyltransferase family protein n=1 Tax=Curtobacterium sp. NPDC087082 TaxID=3363966 RepID=UPI003803F6BC